MKNQALKGALMIVGAFCLVGTANAANSSSYYSPGQSGPAYGKYLHDGGSKLQNPVVQHDGKQSPAVQHHGLSVGKAHHGCNSCGTIGGCNCGCWFGYAGGLLMTRDHDDDVWYSYNTDDLASRLIQSTDADMNWAGGAEVRFGRYSDCGQYAWEAAYWGVYPGTSEKTALATDVSGDLGTILTFDSLEYDPGTGALPVTSFYNVADIHRLRRSYQFHNVELNLLGNPCSAANCSPFVFSWAAGVRYFKFDEGFSYAGDVADATFDGAPEEVYYDVDVDNNLIGFQIGGRADYRYSSCLQMFAGAKLGAYGNHISHSSRIYGSQGNAVINNAASPFDNQEFNVTSNKNDVAFLGELEVGMNYQLTSCWSATLGYRAVAVTGVGLSTDQIPGDYFSDLNGINTVDSNGSLILHGAFAAAVYNY